MRSGVPVGVPVAKLADRAQLPDYGFIPVAGDRSASVTVTANAAAHTMGAWGEVFAVTTDDYSWMLVVPSNTSVSATDTRALLDIGVGAAAAETVIAASLPAGFATLATPMYHLIPVYIPKGSRVSARAQALLTSETVTLSVSLFKAPSVGGLRAATKVDTLGADTAGSRGTNMPTTDVYAEVVAATVQPYRALIMLPCGGAGTVFSGSATYTLGVGAAGAEVALYSMSVTSNANESIYNNDVHPFNGAAFGYFPKGSRVACKQSAGVNYRDVIVIGVP